MLAALLLAASTVWAADGSHAAPAETVKSEPSPFAERQNKLAEMWQRAIIPADTQSYSPQDEELLAKMHGAEESGAIGFLRGAGPIGGFVVELKSKDGTRHRRLTKAGYTQWRLLRTQGALQFFQSKEIGAKEAFLLKDLDGNLLFDKEGFLSDKGQLTYNLLIAGLEAHWVTPSGEVLGNRPPPRRKTP